MYYTSLSISQDNKERLEKFVTKYKLKSYNQAIKELLDFWDSMPF